MNWFVFALFSAVFLAAATLVEKKALLRIHTTDFSAASAFANLFFALPFAYFVDWQKVNVLSLVFIFAAAVLAGSSFYLVAKAVRHLEVSMVSPLLAMNPGATALFGFLVLGEQLERLSVVGILLMIAGSYVLTLEPHRHFLYPFKVFARSRYVHFVFGSVLFYAMGATFDRTILGLYEIPVANYMFFFHIFVGLLFVPVVLFFGHGFHSVWRSFKVESGSILGISMFTILYRFFQMEALSLAYVGLVSAIKRSSSFFSTLIGGELFHEKNIKRKILASAIIILGSIFIIV